MLSAYFLRCRYASWKIVHFRENGVVSCHFIWMEWRHVLTHSRYHIYSRSMLLWKNHFELQILDRCNNGEFWVIESRLKRLSQTFQPQPSLTKLEVKKILCFLWTRDKCDPSNWSHNSNISNCNFLPLVHFNRCASKKFMRRSTHWGADVVSLACLTDMIHTVPHKSFQLRFSTVCLSPPPQSMRLCTPFFFISISSSDWSLQQDSFFDLRHNRREQHWFQGLHSGMAPR